MLGIVPGIGFQQYVALDSFPACDGARRADRLPVKPSQPSYPGGLSRIRKREQALKLLDFAASVLGRECTDHAGDPGP